MKQIHILLVLVLIALTHCKPCQGETKHNYLPKEGLVPTVEVAVQIARAVLIPIYGVEVVNRQEPLVAKLEGDVWEITGTMAHGMKGGVARVYISKTNGCIIRVTHGR